MRANNRLDLTRLTAVRLVCCALALSAALLAGSAQAADPGPQFARRSFFYVGGSYVGEPGKQVMHGQMYVEKLEPAERRQPLPLLLFHGAGQTATNWMGTPDGRPGWADYFLAQGYVVYMVDQPARGRSAWHSVADGALASFSAMTIERLFTTPETMGSWPQAKLHNQWPGPGRMGDPAFDAFYATQVPYLASNAETQTLVQAAGALLLDRVGPAIVLTHSQAGAFGWLLADARPDLVRAIVAVEPLGPPFQDAVLGDARARAWGLTDIRLIYDPPATSPPELRAVQQEQPDAPDLSRCWQQGEPARRLANLVRVPVLVAITEASYHAVYDHCTARYLAQAGVPVTTLRLEDRGIHGNGHMVMVEKNNWDVARILDGWMRQAVGGPPH